MVTHAKAALFLKKKKVFLKFTIFSILIVNQLLTKLSKNKLKIKLQWLHFRFLADISNCFTFFFFFLHGKELYNMLWTTDVTEFINTIFESSSRVLEKKLKTKTLQQHL